MVPKSLLYGEVAGLDRRTVDHVGRRRSTTRPASRSCGAISYTTDGTSIMWGDADDRRPIRSNTRMNRPATSVRLRRRARCACICRPSSRSGALVLVAVRDRRGARRRIRWRGWRWPGWRCCPAGSGCSFTSVVGHDRDRRHVLHRHRAAVRAGAGDARDRRPLRSLFSLRRRRPMQQLAFNAAALALSMWVSASAFFALAGVGAAGDRRTRRSRRWCCRCWR